MSSTAVLIPRRQHQPRAASVCRRPITTQGESCVLVCWPFIFIDGGYTENTGAAVGLARMQRECGLGVGAPSSAGQGGGKWRPMKGERPRPPQYGLDCSSVPQLIIIDHSAPSEPSASINLFRAPPGTPTIGSWGSPEPTFGWTIPAPTIFDASFPAEGAFLSYGVSGGSRFWMQARKQKSPRDHSEDFSEHGPRSHKTHTPAHSSRSQIRPHHAVPAAQPAHPCREPCSFARWRAS